MKRFLFILLLGIGLAGGSAAKPLILEGGLAKGAWLARTSPPRGLPQFRAGDAAGAGERLLLVAGDPSRNLSRLKSRDVSGRGVIFASGEDGPRLTVVSFFTTCCCIHCERELRELKALRDTQPSLRLILVSLDNAMDSGVKAFVGEAGLDAPIVYDDEGSLYEAFGMEQLPQTYVLDRRGRILMEGRRFGEGVGVSSWQSPQLLALLRRAERGAPLGLLRAASAVRD